MYKKLLEQARQKALAAKAILEGDNPNVEEANKLLAEAEALRARAETIKKAASLVDDADATIKAFDALANEPARNSGLQVTADETDKKAKGKLWTVGEFLKAVATGDRLVQPFRTNDAAVEYGYDMTKACGPAAIGSLSDTQKAITGLSEAVPADGGFLVQTEHNNSIMGRVYNVGDLLRRVDMTGIGPNSNGMTFNAEAESSRADGSRRGGILAYWAAEGGTKTPSHPTFRQIELKLNKVIGLVYATDELLQDATALESWIMSNLPEELRFVVEDSIINGTGAGQPQGIIGAPATIAVPAEAGQANTTIVSENIINMWSRRYLGGRDYVWLIHQDATPQLHQMNLGVGAGGGLTYMPPGGLSGAPYGTLMGRPVIESEYCQTLGAVGDIILISLREYQMIDKGGVQSASSIHVNFTTDETCFRFVYRVDGQPKWNLPLTPAHGAVTVSPFLTLAGRP